MNYESHKLSLSRFIRRHNTYFWSIFELSMLMAATYSIVGLIIILTAVMASDIAAVTVIGFVLAPLLAAALFIIMTLTLTGILTLPYYFYTKHRRSIRPRRKAAKPALKRTPA